MCFSMCNDILFKCTKKVKTEEEFIMQKTETQDNDSSCLMSSSYRISQSRAFWSPGQGGGPALASARSSPQLWLPHVRPRGPAWGIQWEPQPSSPPCLLALGKAELLLIQV